MRRWIACGGPRRAREARSIGLEANAADVLPALVARGFTPDVVTDQTSAHDALNGYVPNGLSLQAALALRARDPDDYVARSVAAMGAHVDAMLALQRRGSVVFDYGNNIRAQAVEAGVADAFDIPGVRARVHPAAVLRRQGTLPLGGAFRQSGRHRGHRPRGARDVSGRRGAGAMDSPRRARA